MKLTRHAYVTWWDVHAWGGVIVGLVLAAMFLGGTVSVARHQLEVWQDPPRAPISRAEGDAAIARVLAMHPPRAGAGVSAMITSHRTARPLLWIPGAKEGQTTARYIDPASPTGMRDRTSRVSDVFFHLHFLWHEDIPIGMYLAGLFGVALLLLTVTGVLIHVKDLRRQLYQFRPRARTRTRWTDLHKVLGVWGLPFVLMIGLTGSMICLMGLIAPHLGSGAFEGDKKKAEAELWGAEAKAPKPTKVAATHLGFGELATRAEAALPGMRATYISIEPWGDAAAVATVHGDRPGHGIYPEVRVTLGANDGALIEIDDGSKETTTHDVVHAVYGLHFGDFGGRALELVYFVLGIAGWLVILSGNWIWISRRRTKTRGAELLARLTVGVGGGMLVGGAALLWINRLVPPSSDRIDLEVYGFFAVWLAVTIGALCVPASRTTWALLCAITGCALVFVPVASLVLGPHVTGTIETTVRWVDAGIAVAGALCLLAFWVLRRVPEAPRATDDDAAAEAVP